MPRAISAPEKAVYKTKGQWSAVYMAIHKPKVIYSAVLDVLPTTTDMATEIVYKNGSGTLENIKEGMTLFVGSTVPGSWDLGVGRIRKSPTSDTFYIGENSSINWESECHLTVVEDFQLWQKPIKIIGTTPYMDVDIAYSDQHEDFNPVPILGSHAVVKLVDAVVAVQLGSIDNTTSWVFDSTISSWLWEVPDAVAIDDNTLENPTVQFNTTGWHACYCTVTAANGKSTTGIRWVYVYSNSEPAINTFSMKSVSGNMEDGGWKGTIEAYAGVDISEVYTRAMVILFTEDFANMQPISAPSPYEGKNNILVIGWIAEETVTFNESTGTVEFAIESANYWLRKMSDFTVGLGRKIGTAKDWTDMPGLNVDRMIWHMLYWRTTAMQIMDVFLTEDTRYATEFTVGSASVRDRIDEIAATAIFAICGVDHLSRMFVEIEAQMVPVADRTWTVVDTIEIGDIEGNIEYVKEPEPISYLDFSGVKVDIDNSATAYFSISPGHVHSHIGSPEQIEGVLLASQEQSNELCGLYYGWRNNPVNGFRFVMAGSYRFAEIFPRQFYVLDVPAENDPRGNGYNGNAILRNIEYTHNSKTGYISVEVAFEAESFPGLSITGEAPSGGDISIPSLPDFPEMPPLDYIVIPTPTEEPNEEPKNILLWSSNFGVMYTQNFNTILVDEFGNPEVEWKFMNNGLTAEQKADIQNVIVTPGGTLYMLTRHAEVMAADSLGGTWREVLSYADFPIYTFDYRKIMGIGINPLASDQIGVYGGQVWLISPLHYGMMYMTVGNKNGFGSFNSMVEGHYFEATVQYQNGGWLVFHAGLSGILGGTPYPRIAQCNASGVYADIADNANGWGPASQFAIPIGTTDKSMYWHDNGIQSQYIDIVGISTQTVNEGIAPRNRQAIAMSPTGLCGMAASVSTPYKTTDGGANWTSAAGVIPAGSDVWENCKDDFRWVFKHGNYLALTMDHGATYVDKIGNIIELAPLLNIQGIRYIP